MSIMVNAPIRQPSHLMFQKALLIPGGQEALLCDQTHMPVYNTPSCMGLCRASGFLKVVVVQRPTALTRKHVLLFGTSWTQSTLHCPCWSSLIVISSVIYFPDLNERECSSRTFSCLFLSVFYPFIFFSCLLMTFSLTRKSIAHLGTGWHWHVGSAIWRLMPSCIIPSR